MRSVTTRFLDTIMVSHRLAVQITINGVDIPIIDGEVTLDQTLAVRGTISLTIDDQALIPTSSSSLLAPYGNEIVARRGVAYPDGTSELVQLGVFRIQDTAINDQANQIEITVTGQDRAAKQIDARFEDVYTIAAGTNYTTAIAALLTGGDPAIDTTHLPTTTLTTPLTVANAGDDRWALAQEMATAMGMILYFDGDGTPRMIPTAGGTSPVAEVSEGGILLAASRAWTRQGTYNRAIATGESTDTVTAPVRGVATDDNPASPSYYFGAFGHVPVFYTSQFITTTDQANDAAQGLLARQKGTAQTITFSAIPNPALEPGDAITISRDRLGVNEVHTIDQINIPLAPTGVMTGRTRVITA